MSRTSDLMSFNMPYDQARLCGRMGEPVDLVAAGTTIADAAIIRTNVVTLTNGGAAAGVLLPNFPPGEVIFIQNHSAHDAYVYPHSAAGTIDGAGAGVATTLYDRESALFIRTSDTAWITTLPKRLTAYTPTVSVVAPMTIVSTEAAHGLWKADGDVVHVYLDFNVTTGGTVGNAISATLPVTASATPIAQVGQCYAIAVGGYHTDGQLVIAASGATAVFYLHDFGLWENTPGSGPGANNKIYANFWYQRARI